MSGHINRRKLLQGASAAAGLSWLPAIGAQSADPTAPILVAIELSGGNDGLNSVVPHGDDAYYRNRPTIGIAANELLALDDHYGLNPGMLGLHRLWQDGDLAIVHGCGYERPSYSHFTSMAYWHTGVPHRGNEFGWMGRVADQLATSRRDDMLINIGATQSLAVKSQRHTPVVFDDPERFQRHGWMAPAVSIEAAQSSTNPAREFLHAVDRSAQASSQRIRQAWRGYQTPVDYGIAPMDLPKVAACIDAGLSTQLYHVSFRNNSFDTHVAQPALHRRLLSYACDGIYGFIRDLKRIGADHRVLVLVYSEFGRRVPENANMGTDHGSANVMFLAGTGVTGGHYGEQPSLTELVDGDNLAFTTDFRQVYATAMQGWLGVDAHTVLGDQYSLIPALSKLT
jgi:uncharacterized protein (DUF1501 family)